MQGFYAVYDTLFEKLVQQEVRTAERRGDDRARAAASTAPRFGAHFMSAQHGGHAELAACGSGGRLQAVACARGRTCIRMRHASQRRQHTS